MNRILLVFILLLSIPLTAQEVVVHQLDSEIQFDGMPDESAWDGVRPLEVTMLQPSPGNTPTEKTEILLAYDDQYFWIAGRFYDSDASLIQSNTKKRDDGSDASDFFGIMLDGFNDNENGYIFNTTPAGTRFDMTIYNDGRGQMPINKSWNTFWDVQSTQTHEGWFTEIRIPFSSIRFKEENGRVVMGMTAYRWIPRKNEMITFPEIDPSYGRWAKQRPSLGGDVIFRGISSRKPVYITPYVLAGGQQEWALNDPETEYEKNTDPTLEAGLDMKYSITSDLTLDVTVNTDFAQVENDDQKVNLSRFSLFFPEKRMFFQERSDLFHFALGMRDQVFYSRRIGLSGGIPVRILGGARLTGKIGSWDIGFLDMQTAESDQLPSENFGVLRVRHRIINNYSYAGGIFTSRLGTDGSYDYVYGLDSYIRVFGDDYLDLKFSQNFDHQDTDRTIRDHSLLRMTWDRINEKGFSYKYSFKWSGKQYDPGMGFLRRKDYWVTGGHLRYGFFPDDSSPLFKHQFNVKAIGFFQTGGGLETFYGGPAWEFLTKSQFYGNINLNTMIEVPADTFNLSENTWVPPGRYPYMSLQMRLNTPDSRILSARTEWEMGQFYDGNRFSVSVDPKWSINQSFRLEGKYQFNRVEFPGRNQLFINHIAQGKLEYMISTSLSASIFMQYNTEVDAVYTNFRFRYNPREGNDLYIVFNEGRNTLRDLETPHLPKIQNRLFLVKYTYTFKL